MFTTRGNKIRVISAREMNKKERKIYEQAEKDTVYYTQNTQKEMNEI